MDSALNGIVVASHNLETELAMAMSALRYERNTLVKAVSLPVELLQKMFRPLRQEWKSVIALSQTCSRWRDIVVHDPVMWTYLYMRHVPHQIATLFAQRSQSRPLSIKLLMNLIARPQLPRFWRDMFCYCEAHRIKRFDIVIPRTLTATHLSSAAFNTAWITDTNMPLLEELSVTAPEYPDGLLRSNDFVLRHLLSHDLPSLRSLTLYRVCLPWTCAGYKGLKKLHISLGGAEAAWNNSDGDILQIFRGSPNLEDILLSIPFAIQGTHHIRAIPSSIRLPRAKSVILELVPVDMSYILSSLSLPDSLPLLRLKCKSYILDSIFKYLPAGSKCLPGLDELTALTVDLYNSQLFMRPGPEASSAQEDSRTFILNATDESSLASILALSFEAHLLSTLRSRPFYAVHFRGCGVPSLDTEVVKEVLSSVPFSHTLGLGGCAPQVVDELHASLEDLKLEKLEFYQMDIHSGVLLRLILARKTQIRQLSLLQCTLLAPSAGDASIVLTFLDGLLPGATWYSNVHYRTPDMRTPAPLTLAVPVIADAVS